jgi:bifunctional UDP-N-acetylglucosamine pyrophosphorylase/glucosamine-1-phosphate N-acetyltransferase
MRRGEISRKLYVAILAAGKAKRMNSSRSKVLHEVAGKPLLYFPLKVAKSLNPARIFVIIGGPYMEQIRVFLQDEPVEIIVQEEPKGTGDAVKHLVNYIDEQDSDLFVIPGDAPLLTEKTAMELMGFHRSRGAYATVLTAEVPDPTGYGRIVRSVGDRVLMIVEEADAFPEEKAIKEVNSGMYFFYTSVLFQYLDELRPDNKQGEYYLTDIIEILQRRMGNVFAYKIEDWEEILGVNTREQLGLVNRIMLRRIVHNMLENGVSMVDPDKVYIEAEVQIGKDVTLYPFVSLLGKTIIGDNSIIGPGVVLKDAVIKPNSRVFGPRIPEDSKK